MVQVCERDEAHRDEPGLDRIDLIRRRQASQVKGPDEGDVDEPTTAYLTIGGFGQDTVVKVDVGIPGWPVR